MFTNLLKYTFYFSRNESNTEECSKLLFLTDTKSSGLFGQTDGQYDDIVHKHGDNSLQMSLEESKRLPEEQWHDCEFHK